MDSRVYRNTTASTLAGMSDIKAIDSGKIWRNVSSLNQNLDGCCGSVSGAHIKY